MRKTLEERFWSKVAVAGPDDCWLWTGARVPQGYGQLVVAGRPRGAHRVSYEINKGPIPAGLTVDHLCSNPPCVNPDHLEAVYLQENIQRAVQRGRWREIHMSAQTAPKASDAGYRLYIDHVRRRISTGDLRPGDEIKLPPDPREFARMVNTVGCKAVRSWLTADGSADLVDGRLIVRSTEVIE